MNIAIDHYFTKDPAAFIIVPDGSRPSFEHRTRGSRARESASEHSAPANKGDNKHTTDGEAPLWTWFLPNPRPAGQGTR